MQQNELPREWRELQWIMSNLQTCRRDGDVKGVGKWAKKLAAWRDAHPEEAKAVIETLTQNTTEV